VTHPLILLTGASGQLGVELARSLSEHGNVIAADRQMLDVADADALVSTLRRLRPQLIVNAAAYTAVDRAESEPALAHAVNAIAPGIMAEEAKLSGGMLIHYSTDYVFAGRSTTPYVESAPVAPLNVYGQSKLAGEQAVLSHGGAAIVLRTSWVYGLRGSNFLLTMRKLAATRDEIRVVADQTGVPNWTRTIAEATTAIIRGGLPYLASRAGLYHLSCGGRATWFDFAQAIFGAVERPRLVPIATTEYPTPAQRPAYGVLDASKFQRTFGMTLPSWQDDLRACIASAG
jgi:dTDP-4-dehydrorhamnose reductase